MMGACDPYLDDGMRGYIHRVARDNLGRIAGYDFDDLVQEGLVCYYKCRARYVGPNAKGYTYKKPLTGDGQELNYLPEIPTKTAKRHLLNLVKTTLHNRIATLAWKQPASWELSISDVADDSRGLDPAWEQLVPTEDETATVSMLLATAPSEIKQLFKLLIDDAINLSGCRRYGEGKYARRETSNRYFCRILGLEPGTDIIGMVHRHFFGDQAASV